jgi:3-oxoacyl-[acyl-carrier protein] reductase
LNILITGASRGIGKAIALEFGKTGFNKLYLTYNKTHINDMVDLKEELEEMCNQVYVFQMNVTKRKKIGLIVDLYKSFADFKLDVLVNNAGVVRDRTLAKMTDNEWDDVINTNLTGVFNVTKAFLPYINDGGCIINMASIIGITGNFGQCNYSASKAGVIAFTKSLAKELAKRNIRVNSVSPSFVNTDMTQRMSPEQYAKVVERMPFKRMATTEEIAKFVVFLAKDATYCTGENYIIGGLE